jgi:hypothetical protein
MHPIVNTRLQARACQPTSPTRPRTPQIPRKIQDSCGPDSVSLHRLLLCCCGDPIFVLAYTPAITFLTACNPRLRRPDKLLSGKSSTALLSRVTGVRQSAGDLIPTFRSCRVDVASFPIDSSPGLNTTNASSIATSTLLTDRQQDIIAALHHGHTAHFATKHPLFKPFLPPILQQRVYALRTLGPKRTCFDVGTAVHVPCIAYVHTVPLPCRWLFGSCIVYWHELKVRSERASRASAVGQCRV